MSGNAVDYRPRNFVMMPLMFWKYFIDGFLSCYGYQQPYDSEEIGRKVQEDLVRVAQCFTDVYNRMANKHERS